jgi:NADPH:quinone reductase-like Zn-dependent oxidoreductase
MVASVGEGVSGFSVGEEVFGMNDWFVNGALAEFCVAPVSAVVPKPRTLSHAQAAIVPISTLTAWQGLFDHGKLAAGQRVLIHGGAGAVGAFAVQFAHFCGAHVIATASAHNSDFLRELGADEVIDYKAARFEERVKDIDLVFDGVGGETLARSWQVLRPRGRLVTIVSQDASTTDKRAKDALFIVEAKAAQLSEIGRQIDQGEIRWFLEAVFPLEKAGDAYGQSMRGSKRGKVAVEVV